MSFSSHRWLVGLAAAAALAGYFAVSGAGRSAGVSSARAATAGISAPRRIAAKRLRPRAGAVKPGTTVSSSALFTVRVFANGSDGFALANDQEAQYPVRSVDGGQTWRIDGPQLHVDAADGPQGVGFVDVDGPRTLFAYGSSVVDVTTNAGGTWWQAYLGELVVAVVPQSAHTLVAYVQQQTKPDSVRHALTWQYVSRNGGRSWTYSTNLGGLRG